MGYELLKLLHLLEVSLVLSFLSNQELSFQPDSWSDWLAETKAGMRGRRG